MVKKHIARFLSSYIQETLYLNVCSCHYLKILRIQDVFEPLLIPNKIYDYSRLTVKF